MIARQAEQPCGLRAASSPPEARGLSRSRVQLLVSTSDRDVTTRFDALADFIDPGDLLVLNTSKTRKAAVDLDVGLTLHVSSPTEDGDWIVEFRRASGRAPHRGPVPSTASIGGVRLDVVAPYNDDEPTRLWRARFDGDIETLLERQGRYIEYDYAAPTAAPSWRQNVYATDVGSAELASAGRPLTEAILHRLEALGARIAPLVLHCGVSSQESGESPHPEFYDVPEETMRAVFETRAAGGRVIAVGTTVVRALETAARTSVRRGFTDLLLGPQTRPVMVDGLLSGFHPPEASHLDLLAAVVGAGVVRRAYGVACGGGFTSHEFGDSHLLLR